MESIELTAKSADEARLTAAEKLGVSPDRVNVTVLEQIKGLFGKSQVRVKAEVIPSAEPKAAKAEKPAPAPKAEKPAKAEKPKKEVKAEEPEAEAEPVAAAEPAPEPKRGGRGRKPEAAPAAAKEEEEESAPQHETVATDADGEKLLDILKSVIEASGLQVDADVAGLNGRYVNLRLDGRDAAFLVGKHGEVLNSLQYLLNLMASRKHESGVRIALDANEYRKRREDALTALANNVAQQVISRGEEAVLQALPAFERRIVHKALGEIEGIVTYSEGEEPNRRVVIAPAD